MLEERVICERVFTPVGLDNWLNLTRVDPDEEIQGEIHLCLELHRDTHRTCLKCDVIEAR